LSRKLYLLDYLLAIISSDIGEPQKNLVYSRKSGCEADLTKQINAFAMQEEEELLFSNKHPL
jgi:hypothetical protein